MLMQDADVVVEALHRAGADIHVTDVAGNTPLHVAAAAAGLADLVAVGSPMAHTRPAVPCVLFLLQHGTNGDTAVVAVAVVGLLL
jgi:hypothetical protein